jgi:hypothetical protein
MGTTKVRAHELYKISYCRGCNKQRVVAKDSHMCARCAMLCIEHLVEFLSQKELPPWYARGHYG